MQSVTPLKLGLRQNFKMKKALLNLNSAKLVTTSPKVGAGHCVK